MNAAWFGWAAQRIAGRRTPLVWLRLARRRKAWNGGWMVFAGVRLLGTHAGLGRAHHVWAWRRSSGRGIAWPVLAWNPGWSASTGVRALGIHARLGMALALLVPAPLGWSRHRVARPVKAWTGEE